MARALYHAGGGYGIPAARFELAAARARLEQCPAASHRGATTDGISGKRGNAMTNQQTQTSAKASRTPAIAIMLPCLLIGQFLWNVLTPAHEFPMRTEQVITMTFDFLMLVGLFALKASMPKPLFWIALVAGIGLFALRLSADGWWTGHLVYSLSPR
jgi:hypothetical protein